MQFIVTGHDGTDEGALERRLAVRDEHMKLVETMKKEGRYLYAAALLGKEEKMIGSVLIVDFPSMNELEQWLNIEPYVKGNVWKQIDIKPCKVPPIFME
jgi:uncharacterized protein